MHLKVGLTKRIFYELNFPLLASAEYMSMKNLHHNSSIGVLNNSIMVIPISSPFLPSINQTSYVALIQSRE
jgi:hypothetical protein